ncbi:Transposase [Streptomyces sp. 3213]|nr:Transposase [Streptomyces sp. 3213] [Streptomyces sp. 3213.3]
MTMVADRRAFLGKHLGRQRRLVPRPSPPWRTRREFGPHLPKSGQHGGRWEGHRRVTNGILFRQRTGAPWRDLPARFGRWKTVYERHRRWSADGTWDKLFAAVLADADAEATSSCQ